MGSFARNFYPFLSLYISSNTIIGQQQKGETGARIVGLAHH
jgi:hypothetical protein